MSMTTGEWSARLCPIHYQLLQIPHNSVIPVFFCIGWLLSSARAISSGMEKCLYPDERLVFVDLETAGLESWRPIIQLAAIAVGSDGRELETYEAKLRFKQSLADPRSLHKNNYSHGLWLREAESPSVVAEALAQLLMRHATVDQQTLDGRIYQVAQLVAHNAGFDGEFLKAWFNRMRLFLPASPRVLCTVQRAMWVFHENKALTPPRDFKLGTLCEYFEVPLSAEDAHDALNDVRATVALYRALSKVNAAIAA